MTYRQMVEKWLEDHKHYKSPKGVLREMAFIDIFYSDNFKGDFWSIGDLKQTIEEVIQ